MSEASYRRRLAFALGVAAVIVVTAPVLGRLRDLLLDTFGARFLGFLAIGLTLAGALVFGLALRSIRENRLRRYGWLAVAGALVAFQLWWWASGDQRVDLVERVHLIEYGSLALLFHRVFELRFRGWAPAALALLAVGTAGVADELAQWWSPIRTGDQRDVWLNLFAGLIGLCVARALAGPSPAASVARAAPSLWALAALFLASFGTLVELAHLGFTAGDEAIRFRSFFAPGRLPVLAADRAARWATSPPKMTAYGREDFFLTEAAWHVQARNSAWEAGDWTGAWVENRILELWYPPFLDLVSFRNGVVHRWPPEQRAQAEAGCAQPLPGAPGPYWSPVLAGRVVIGPWVARLRAGFLAAVACSLTGWWLSRRRASRSSNPTARRP
jgi:hypothetical protein